MPQFHNIGSRIELPEQGVAVEAFGATLELEQDAGEQMARNGVPILPSDIWRGLGITPAELKTANFPHLWQTPEGQSFATKRSSAFLAFAEYQASLQEEVTNG